MNRHWLARIRETYRTKGFWAGTPGKGDHCLCFAVSSGTEAQAQWDRPVLLPKPESENNAPWNCDLEEKHRVKFLLPSDKGVVIWFPITPVLSMSQRQCRSLVLLFSLSLLPSPAETVTLPSWFSGPLLACSHMAEGIVYRQPGLWAPLLLNYRWKGWFPCQERKVN